MPSPLEWICKQQKQNHGISKPTVNNYGKFSIIWLGMQSNLAKKECCWFTVDVISQERVIAKRNCALDDLVQFIVKDYGKGIDLSKIHNIFQPFQQTATNKPTYGRTGSLGLAITPQLVQILGSTISAESKYGSWCQFTILLQKYPEQPFVTPVHGGAQLDKAEKLDLFSLHLSTVDDNNIIVKDDGLSMSDKDSSLSTSFSSNHHLPATFRRSRNNSLTWAPLLSPCGKVCD